MGLQSLMAAGLDLGRETMRCCCVKGSALDKTFQWKIDLHKRESFSHHQEAPACLFFFSANAEIQLKLRSTPIII